MRKSIILGAVCCVLLLLLAGAVYEYRRQQREAQILTGTIEVTKADITPKTSGYIEALFIREGDAVTKGMLAARLSRKDLEAAHHRDLAARAASEASLAKLLHGNRAEEIRRARSDTAAARAASDKAARDYARMEELMAADAISRSDYDAALEARDAAAARLAAAQETEALMEQGARTEDIDIARENLAETTAAAAISAEALSDLSVAVPMDGVILTKNYEEGEYVAAGAPIATMADLSDAWVKVYISTEEMGRLHIGDPAEVRIDGTDKVWQGRIREIKDSAEYTPRQSISRNERANLVFAVKVALPNEDGLLKPGMPADVTFHEQR